MQSNTAAVESRPVNFPSFSVEKKTYKPDSFTITDGHCTGSDGFVVPKDFEEFYQRFPNYLRNWVGKHADKSAPKEDLEDWTQDLLIHLYHLPQASKHRRTGKEDIVETFDPIKHYGANEARFRNYINLCLSNKFRTIHSKCLKDGLCRCGNLSFDGQTEREDLCAVDDEYCHSHSAYLRTAAETFEKQFSDRAFLQEFLNFVRRQDQKVLSATEAIFATGTQADAADWLGITETEFGRMRTRLRQLAKCFANGEPIPKQRRHYKKRTVKTKDVAGSRLAA